MSQTEMIPLFFAVLSASLIGSAHCVGMCGPFAIMVLNDDDSNTRRAVSMGWYHFGRVITYMLIGSVAGLAGSWLDQGTSLIGWQQSAAWLTGVGMIVFGTFALLRLLKVGTLHFQAPAGLQNMVRKGFRKANKLPKSMRPLAIGSVTGFLPCGWLYAFLLLATGTSSPFSGAIVMLAFWIGTVPALSVIGLGFSKLSQSWKKAIPLCTAVLMILAGISTLSVRAHAELSDMMSPKADSENMSDAIDDVTGQPMPCCQAAGDQSSGDQGSGDQDSGDSAADDTADSTGDSTDGTSTEQSE